MARHTQLQSDLDFGRTESYETLKYTVFVQYAECVLKLRAADTCN